MATLWYRAPELLLGATRCSDDGPALDAWSCGCLVAELLRGAPILPGNTEIEQVDLIFALCGSPTIESWPSGPDLPLWDTFCNVDEDDSSVKERTLRERFSAFDAEALDLVDAILQCDPSSRLSASDATAALPVGTRRGRGIGAFGRRVRAGVGGGEKAEREEESGRARKSRLGCTGGPSAALPPALSRAHLSS